MSRSEMGCGSYFRHQTVSQSLLVLLRSSCVFCLEISDVNYRAPNLNFLTIVHTSAATVT